MEQIESVYNKFTHKAKSHDLLSGNPYAKKVTTFEAGNVPCIKGDKLNTKYPDSFISTTYLRGTFTNLNFLIKNVLAFKGSLQEN